MRGAANSTDRPYGLESRKVVAVMVDSTSYADAVGRIKAWAERAESRYVCACNVHMVMEAHDDPPFRDVVQAADLVTPDGVPLVWALRLMGVRGAGRVYGPDLMLELCAMAARDSVPIGLHGSEPAILDRLTARLRERFPGLSIVYAGAPPFGPDPDESARIEQIRASGARILFVALGCPKQERWMARQRGHIPAVMVGVGAAFDFIAGSKRQAPRPLQMVGLEWAFRLASEPGRLWRRYMVHNPRFMWLLARQLFRQGRTSR